MSEPTDRCATCYAMRQDHNFRFTHEFTEPTNPEAMTVEEARRQVRAPGIVTSAQADAALDAYEAAVRRAALREAAARAYHAAHHDESNYAGFVAGAQWAEASAYEANSDEVDRLQSLGNDLLARAEAAEARIAALEAAGAAVRLIIPEADLREIVDRLRVLVAAANKFLETQ